MQFYLNLSYYNNTCKKYLTNDFVELIKNIVYDTYFYNI